MSSSDEVSTSPAAASRSLSSATSHALDRATEAALSTGNAVELLIDAADNFNVWLAAIKASSKSILLDNYIIADDDIGRQFRAALCERAENGVRVAIVYDWVGCLGMSRKSFWRPLIESGAAVRAYNPPRWDRPFGWIGRDHRKLLVVDGDLAFVSGLCIAQKWLGDPAKGVAPWRDTGVSIRGPACADVARAFVDNWARLGPPLELTMETPAPAGDCSLRVIASRPHQANVFRTDLFIASIARQTLWLSDAYFVGSAAYVQALCAAAQDGVDVRLLVPGTSDLKLVAQMSRAGYRPLLEAGVRVYEWNGSMLHAKTAVADARWARVGSSNLNIASWLNNCEIDVAVEDPVFAQRLAAQYEIDLRNSTEVVLTPRARVARAEPSVRRGHRGSGSSSRAAASTIRLVNTVGAALGNRRVLGMAEAGLLPPAALALIILASLGFIWPAIIAWPFAAVGLWVGVTMLLRYVHLRRERSAAKSSSGIR